MPKNYYIVLGISREANLHKIKKAYRKIAKQYHPDIAQTGESSERFREIKDAYETLMDEEKRRKYDIELEKQEFPVRINRAPSNIRPRSSYFNDLKSRSSYVDEFFEGLIPGFFPRERLRAPSKDLYFEIILTPLEARKGGLYPIRFPVFETCPRCTMSGYRENFFCPVCFGYGCVKAEREISLSVPPNVSHGTQTKLSLEDIGMKDVYLNLVVSVDPSLEDDNW